VNYPFSKTLLPVLNFKKHFSSCLALWLHFIDSVFSLITIKILSDSFVLRRVILVSISLSSFCERFIVFFDIFCFMRLGMYSLFSFSGDAMVVVLWIAGEDVDYVHLIISNGQKTMIKIKIWVRKTLKWIILVKLSK